MGMTVASDLSGRDKPETDAAMDAAGVGTWRWHLAKQRVMFSDQAAALFAAKVTELSQNQFLALVHPHDRKTMAWSVLMPVRT